MADVLNFPLDRVGQTKRGKTDEVAEVVIFPGVRIERGEFSLSDRLPRARRKKFKPGPLRAAKDKRSS